MNKQINCFVANYKQEDTQILINELSKSQDVNCIYVLSKEQCQYKNAEWIKVDKLYGSETIEDIAEYCDTMYSLFILEQKKIELGQFAIERMLQVATHTRSAMVYANYNEVKNQVLQAHPLISYQIGSLRNDFNFGAAQLYHNQVISDYLDHAEDVEHAAFYELRLQASRLGKIEHIPELLFTIHEDDTRQSGEKQFDYVNPSARELQIEMEKVCTKHLMLIDAKLEEDNFKMVAFDEEFPIEASVIIPVRNRVRTIKQAIDSALSQKCDFKFNVIVVDNHSTDGTSEILSSYTSEQLVVIKPQRNDLGIGGCWNEAVFSKHCGRFAIQLDSDDLYFDNTSLQQIVVKFYEESCAMVIGSYQMCNFELEEIPPGIIDHAEWTPHNGANNALRINGLGAPRAFYTPVFRSIRIPNTSYGEDYAMGLAISRNYKIGRIYKPIYRCRRWKDNTDASLDIAKENAHNYYKDSIRTFELMARMQR